MRIIMLSTAKENLEMLLDDTCADRLPSVIVRAGGPSVVMLHVDEYHKLCKDSELLANLQSKDTYS